MAIVSKDSIDSYSRLTSMNDFENYTREVVLDFMGLVPITCPPSSISFKPFEGAKEGIKDPLRDEVDGRRTFRVSDWNDGSKHKTIIRKLNKLVILEEEEFNLKTSKSFPPSKPVSKRRRFFKFFNNIAEYFRPRGLPLSQSNREIKSQTLSDNSKLSMKDEKLDSVDGLSKPVELSINKVPFNWKSSSFRKTEVHKPSKPLQKFQSILRKKNKRPDFNLKGKKESIYVDVGDMDDIDGMVNKKHLSPSALSLQKELQDIKSRSSTPSISPQTQVANSLRAIADQVQLEYSDELTKAVGRLVNYEEVSRLGYEELKKVAMEVLKDVTPGWSQVAVPLLLSQMVAMSLLDHGSRNVVSRMVDLTTQFICGAMNNFVTEQGGWDGVKKLKVNEISIENSIDEEKESQV